MSEDAKAFDAAIDDLRALMDALIASDWQELHLVDDQSEIFIARESGRTNPMLGFVDDASPGGESGAWLGTRHDVTAPHVATLLEITAKVGDMVEKGTVITRLSVLEEVHEISAPCSGMIIKTFANEGDLVEFGSMILQIAEDG